MSDPKCLILDIETSPITVYSWGLYDQNLSLGQMKEDWSILAWGAKWYGSKETLYEDNRGKKNVHDDKALIQKLSDLMNEADIIITQNGDRFDFKKINARAVINGLPPIKPSKSTDIYKEGKKVFSFTSHSLEYISGVLNTKYKKLKHKNYPGHSLWNAVMTGDLKAWKEMEEYCIHDVLATEEAYDKIRAWIKTQNLSLYSDDARTKCSCGSTNLEKRGYAYTDLGKFQSYRCRDCGRWPRSRVNLLSKDKRGGLLK